MAHYKRKRARIKGSGHYSANGLQHRLGDRYDGREWLRNWPRAHDILFHTRPGRRACRRLERKVLAGADADGVAWPLSKKPHVYYW